MQKYTPASLLFTKYDVVATYNNITEVATKDVRELDRKYFLSTNEQDLLRFFEEKYCLYPLKIFIDEIEHSDEPVDVDISHDFSRAAYGSPEPVYLPMPLITFHIPFEGDAKLFEFAPYFHHNPPRGKVGGRMLQISILAQDGNIQKAAEDFEREKQKVIDCVKKLNLQIERSRTEFLSKLAQAISVYRAKFEAEQAQIEALPYPKKSELSSTPVSVLKKRALPVSMVPPLSGRGVGTPILPIEDYEFIIKTLNGMSRVFETAPDDFRTMSEPGLRSHFLVQLNGVYEGNAKGEVFNGNGKTDIFINHENKTLFAAECKFYDGQKSVTDTINQLLGYITWRDTKAAIIFLSRKADFSNVLETIKATVPIHHSCTRVLDSKIDDGETILRYEFSQRTDTSRKMLLTFLVFNVPKED